MNEIIMLAKWRDIEFMNGNNGKALAIDSAIGKMLRRKLYRR